MCSAILNLFGFTLLLAAVVITGAGLIGYNWINFPHGIPAWHVLGFNASEEIDLAMRDECNASASRVSDLGMVGRCHKNLYDDSIPASCCFYSGKMGWDLESGTSKSKSWRFVSFAV